MSRGLAVSVGRFAPTDSAEEAIFLRSDFEIIASQLDTFPDFMEYLSTRERLMCAGVLSPTTNELDFLAIYKTRRNLIEDCLEGRVTFLVTVDGLWRSHQQDHQEQIRARDARLAPSYLVDSIIAEFHKGASYGIGEGTSRLQRSEQIEHYLKTISELAALSRAERVGVAQLLLDKMRAAEIRNLAYGIVQISQHSAILVLSSTDDRIERARRLHDLSLLAYVHLGLAKVVGIATEPKGHSSRSYDCCIAEGIEFENEEEVRESAQQFFGPLRRTTFNEWRD